MVQPNGYYPSWCIEVILAEMFAEYKKIYYLQGPDFFYTIFSDSNLLRFACEPFGLLRCARGLNDKPNIFWQFSFKVIFSNSHAKFIWSRII